MTINIGSVGDKGENRAITQFAESELFRADFFHEGRIHAGWDIVVQLLDRDTHKSVSDIFYIQAKNYSMDISNEFVILDGAIEVWHLKRWELIPNPTLVVAYNNKEDWNPKESGYWIWYNEIINQIEKRNPNWKHRKDNSKVRVKFPISNKLSPDGLNIIHQGVLNHYTNLRRKLKTKETSPIKPMVQDFTYNFREVAEYPGVIINSFFIDIFKQILSEYRVHEIISKICTELKYSESKHQHLEFSMFPKRLSIPHNDIQKNSIAWIVHTFGSSIAYGELDAVFDLILNSDLIEKKNDIDFSRESIISIFDSLNFKPTYILISNDLFVEWTDIFPDRVIFEEKQIFMKFEDEMIPIIFVINDLSYKKVLLIKQDSIESVVKYAEDTIPIINFQNDIPIGPRGEKIDIRVRSNGENNIEFAFRTVRSLNLVKPDNILILEFKEINN